MFGPSGVGAETGQHHSLMGVIPRVCAHCFDSLGMRNGQSNGPSKRIEASLFVSFIEVYGEQVNDLLNGGSPVGHSQVAATRFVMDGAAEVPVTSAQDLLVVLETGEQHKRTASTRMNERSTRAHSLVVLKLVQQRVDNGLTIQSQFYLADLGGSEQIKKSLFPSTAASANPVAEPHETASGAASTSDNDVAAASPTSSEVGGASNEVVDRELMEQEQADRKREAVQINMGLLALKRVITALKEKRRHIPYQDSKLTMLLSSGLGGDSKTTVVVCASREPQHMAETLSTLRFGEECASVRTRVRKGVAVIASLVEEVDARMKVLGDLIRSKERWVNKKVVRVDTNFEAGTLEATLGGQEQVMTSVLEGAEKERKELEMLVIRRAELVGDDVETSLLEAGFKGFGRFAAGAMGTEGAVVASGVDASDSRFS
jgi:kinesin family protein 5